MTNTDFTDAPVRLRAGTIEVWVDAAHGGRLASMRVEGREFLVSADSHDPMLWGAYPMVPFAGRVRNGVLRFGNSEHRLRLNASPHSIHGSVFDAPWTVQSVSDTSVVLRCPLGDEWPWGGTVHHAVTVTTDSVQCELTVTAAGHSMPAQVGWHPWFVPETTVTWRFGAMLARDNAGITTAQRVVAPTGDVDDCFVEPLEWPRVALGDTVLEMRSDCSHWVVFDQMDRGTCVEPQSGAPNGVNDDPVVLNAGESLTRWMEWRLVARDEP